MMIGIDGNEANQKVRVGSGVYAFELLRQFKEFSPPAGGLEFRIYLKDKSLEDLPIEARNWQYKIIGPNKLWTQVGLPIELWKEKILREAPNIFFTPTHYAPRFCPVPSVITIFDLSFIRFPELFLKKDLYQLKNWTKYSVKQAKKIITISEFSKKEIVDYYKANPNKIVVAYPGFDRERFNNRITNYELRITNIKNKYKITGDYILYVGTIQPRKNLVRLTEAFKRLEAKNLRLVLCGMIDEGRGGWMQKEFFKTSNENVIITGFVSDEDLSYLMAGATTLVLTSLYEGFGIPVVEAMACGVPTVVSNSSSLPEIAGDAAILVNPYDVDSITNGMSEACYNNSKREVMTKRGLQQVKKYDWEKSAKIVLDTLKSFL